MEDKPLVRIGSSLDDVRKFPEEARRKAVFELRTLQCGAFPSDFKQIREIGNGVEEIRIRTEDAFASSMLLVLKKPYTFFTPFRRNHKKHHAKKSSWVVADIRSCNSIEQIGLKESSMKKTIRKGSRNVFEDLGFDQVEAANLKLRSDLMIALRTYIKNQGWTQMQAADFFGITQPRVSNLMQGEIDRFSIDTLVVMLARAGMRVDMKVMKKAA